MSNPTATSTLAAKPPSPAEPGEIRQALLWSALVALLFVAANYAVIYGLFRTWWVSYAETGHGFIAPPLAAYLVWMKREELAKLPLAGKSLGLVVVALCALVITISHLAQWVFFSQFCLWLSLVAAVWYIAGPAWVKALRFPLLLLLFTIPPPSFLYTRLTFELQLLASRLGEFGLEALGFSVLREGNVLHMVGEKLSVAEACSGIRSLVTLLFFVMVYGYFMLDTLRGRLILLGSAIPVAIFANGLRIVATGVLSQYNRELAHGITHEVSGYVTLFGGGLCCILLEQWMRRSPATPATTSQESYS
ncbi:MAG: exosortase A [Bryobacter sp.]